LADNVAATSTRINNPFGVSVDASGNVYIGDYNNHRIRFVPKVGGTYFGQVMTANYIYTIAGDGTGGYSADNVAATSAWINFPSGVTVDVKGNLYFADYVNHRIRFVPKTGGTYFGQTMTANSIYTIAGNGTSGYLADNVAATTTRIKTPKNVSLDAGGNVYIVDGGNNRIRFVPKTSGTYFGQTMTANYIYTIAGNGTAGYLADNVAATSTRIFSPSGVCVDAGGNVSVADTTNHRIRFVPKTSGTYFGQTMTANFIYTIAGNYRGSSVEDNVNTTTTRIASPNGVSVDVGGNIYIADNNVNRIRFIPKTSGTYFGQTMMANHIYTIAGYGWLSYDGDNAVATAKGINPNGVSVDTNGNVYIADISNNRIRFIPTNGGTYFGQAMTANYIYTIAGNGTGGYVGDNVAATSTQINNPNGVSVDSGGNVYVADTNNHRIRFIPTSGGTYFGQTMTANYIYTIAGNGTGGYVADNVSGTSTQINSPNGVSVESNGNVIIADSSNHRIRFVPKTGGTYFGQTMTANYIYTIAGNGTLGYVADNVAATSTQINSPNGVSVDVGGNVFVADSSNHRIRFIPTSGGTYFGQSMTANYIYTIGGTGSTDYNGENAGAIGKNINTPQNVYAGSDHMIYLTDTYNNKIRMIAGEDFIAPSTSTLVATPGWEEVTLSWGSAGDDGPYNNLTGNYRIQYATYTVSWSTASTPTDATTVTIATTSATPGSAQEKTITSLTNGTTYYFVLWSEDEVNNWSLISNTTSTWPGDLTAPSTSTLTATPGDTQITLNWDSAGDDGMSGNLTGNYRIQYATYTVSWSTASTPTDATTVTIATTSATPGSAQEKIITSLTNGTTYYFVLWSEDDSNNWSGISNTTSTWPGDNVAPSTSTLAAVTGSLDGEVDLSWNSAGDDGMTGDLTGNYRIQYATYTVSWSTASTPTDANTVTIGTTSVTPGSAQSKTMTGLIAGTTYYFVLWSQDEANNWSVISATVSAAAFITVRSVSITGGGAQDWGSVMMGSTVAGSTGTVLLNDGNVANTYSLTASTVTAGSPWSVQSSTPAGPNQLVIYGAFHGSTPVSGDYGAEDVVYGTGQSSTGTKFSVDGSSTGASVPSSENRTLWIRMDFPTTTTTVEQQTIKVQVTAQAP
jgi:hypothetical protein